MEGGTYKSLGEAAVSNQLSISSLGHRRNGRRLRQEDEQIFSPTAEKAVVKWILKLDSYGFSPRVDILMGLVKHLAKEDTERQIQKKRHTKEPYWQELDRPIFEPPFKSLLKVC